jgi:hypothetical protein
MLLAEADQLVEERAQRARVMQLGGLFELRRGMPDKAYRLLIDSAAALKELDPRTALETLVLAGEAAAFIGTPALAAEVGALAAAVPAGPSPENRLMVALLGGLARALGGDRPAERPCCARSWLARSASMSRRSCCGPDAPRCI